MTSTLAYVYMRNGTTLRNVAAAPCNVHALVNCTAEASHYALQALRGFVGGKRSSVSKFRLTEVTVFD
jgi:hypothetical protein